MLVFTRLVAPDWAPLGCSERRGLGKRVCAPPSSPPKIQPLPPNVSPNRGSRQPKGCKKTLLSSVTFAYFLRIYPWERDCGFPGAGRGFLLQIMTNPGPRPSRPASCCGLCEGDCVRCLIPSLRAVTSTLLISHISGFR